MRATMQFVEAWHLYECLLLHDICWCSARILSNYSRQLRRHASGSGPRFWCSWLRCVRSVISRQKPHSGNRWTGWIRPTRRRCAQKNHGKRWNRCLVAGRPPARRAWRHPLERPAIHVRLLETIHSPLRRCIRWTRRSHVRVCFCCSRSSHCYNAL